MTGKRLELEFLGTGTSIGIPVPTCRCAVCNSADPRDTRWRASALIRNKQRNLVIDSGPEFRLQCVRAGFDSLAALILTHDHIDHINGLDDLRAFTFDLPGRPREKSTSIPVYCSAQSIATIQKRFDYIWNAIQVGGGLPQIELNAISGHQTFNAAGLEVTAIPLKHGKKDIFGFRIGRLAYLTDISALPEASLPLVQDLDVLILSFATRTPHETHFSLREMLQLHASLKPRRTFLTHITHYFSHQGLLDELPPDIHPAYDGMKIEFFAD